MIKLLVEKLISMKKRQLFVFDKNVTSLYVTKLFLRYCSMFIRGAVKIKLGLFVGKDVSILASSQIVCKGNGKVGDFCKVDALSAEGIYLGTNFSLGDFSVLKCSGTLSDLGAGIKIGNNVGIGEFSYIGGAGGVIIGSDTIVGQYFSIHPENHVFTNLTHNIREQGVTRKGVKIGSNCWIGSKVTILDGSEIGNGCVIAAGAVVSGKFVENSVIGGVPARVLKKRESLN